MVVVTTIDRPRTTTGPIAADGTIGGTIGWTIAYVVAIVLGTVLSLGFEPERPVATVAVSIVSIGWFVAWASRGSLAMLPTTRGVVVVGVTIGLWLVQVTLDREYVVVMFILFPLTAYVLTWWAAAPFVVLLTGAWIAVLAPDTDGVLDALALPVAVGAGTVVFSRWMEHLVDQSVERQSLIDELAATRSRLADAERAAGAAAERQRLAREVHDSVAQSLTSIVLLTGTIRPHVSDHDAAARVDLLDSTARDGLASARRLVRAEHHQREHDTSGSLTEVLGDLVAGATTGTDLVARAHISGTPRPLPGPVEVVLARAAREGLANVVKHAHATRVDVTISYMDGSVALDVHDDGVGPPPSGGTTIVAGGTGGHGLADLERQVRALGGALELEGAAGSGTTLSVSLDVTGLEAETDVDAGAAR